MLLIRHVKKALAATLFKRGCIATIGNFDGLHSGHRAILEKLKAQSKVTGLPSVVVTFEPLPREYFLKNKNTQVRLTRFKEKFFYLEQWGIDVFVCLHFNQYLSKLSAECFVDQVLIQALNIKHLIVGDDFQFGHQREGNLLFLQEKAKQQRFSIEIAPVTSCEERRISSTWIREALQENNLPLAEKLLGRPYSLFGKVIHGDKRARQWGVPTANLNVHRSIIPTVLPVKGVYAVLVKGKGLDNLPGVANVGSRPTVDGFRNLLEVHLLDFEGDIYDQVVEVIFVHKLRDEKKFDSIDVLKQQILEDVATVKHFFLDKIGYN
jgi:riboflavin kinase/FMN adenylyltransferase